MEMMILILTAEEQRDLQKAYGRQIVSTTGYNPNKIERVEELTADEKIFFTQKNFISPHFSVQTLYKVQGEITMKFSAQIFVKFAGEPSK